MQLKWTHWTILDVVWGFMNVSILDTNGRKIQKTAWSHQIMNIIHLLHDTEILSEINQHKYYRL